MIRPDPDPIAVPFLDAEAWGRGYDAGYEQAEKSRRLSIVPFAWGLVGGAAIVLIIVLVALGAGR